MTDRCPEPRLEPPMVEITDYGEPATDEETEFIKENYCEACKGLCGMDYRERDCTKTCDGFAEELERIRIEGWE